MMAANKRNKVISGYTCPGNGSVDRHLNRDIHGLKRLVRSSNSRSNGSFHVALELVSSLSPDEANVSDLLPPRCASGTCKHAWRSHASRRTPGPLVVIPVLEMDSHWLGVHMVGRVQAEQLLYLLQEHPPLLSIREFVKGHSRLPRDEACQSVLVIRRDASIE